MAEPPLAPADESSTAGAEGGGEGGSPTLATDGDCMASEPAAADATTAISPGVRDCAARRRESAAGATGKDELYAPCEIVVRIGMDELRVDLNICAPQAAAFAAVRTDLVPAAEPPRSNAAEDDTRPAVYFDDFPGGVQQLKQIVKYFEETAAEERGTTSAAGELGMPAGGAFHVEFDSDNVGAYLEGAAFLRCPRLMREAVLAPAAKELSSRKVLALLERVIQYTLDVEGPEPTLVATPQVDGAGHPAVDAEEETREADGHEQGAGGQQVMQAFCQVIQRLCARLDAMDFKLSAVLAAGSPWASLEVLRAYRVKVENFGRMNYALQSVTSTVKAFFYEEDKSVQQHLQDWKEHHFALHVFRKQMIESTLNSTNSFVKASAEKAMEDEDDVNWSEEEDDKDFQPRNLNAGDQAEDDIPEAICDGATDATLASLAGLVVFCDPLQTPPVLAAAMVRSLLLVSQVSRARALFEAVFVRSRKVQVMVTVGSIPVDFLGSVKAHRVASIVLRRILQRYESLDHVDFCHLVDHVLLEDFREQSHCLDLVLSNALVKDIVVYCRVSTRAVAHLDAGRAASEGPAGGGAGGGAGRAALVAGTSGEAKLLRLRRVGEKLFAAAFVLHNGFLPLKEEPDHRGENWPAGPLGVAQCPWDDGDLDLPLLQHVPSSEDSLHLARRVLLRGLFRRQQAGVENDVPTTVRLWGLGCWRQCRDAVLISEAFGFMTNCWWTLRSAKAAAGWEGAGPNGAVHWLSDEESLFKMFSDLEFWRLQRKELLTPWVPPQLLACHIAARCKQLDEQQRSILEENQNNLAEINRLRHTISQLIAKLEVVDSRSIQSMQKQAEVVETVRTLR